MSHDFLDPRDYDHVTAARELAREPVTASAAQPSCSQSTVRRMLYHLRWVGRAQVGPLMMSKASTGDSQDGTWTVFN